MGGRATTEASRLPSRFGQPAAPGRNIGAPWFFPSSCLEVSPGTSSARSRCARRGLISRAKRSSGNPRRSRVRPGRGACHHRNFPCRARAKPSPSRMHQGPQAEAREDPSPPGPCSWGSRPFCASPRRKSGSALWASPTPRSTWPTPLPGEGLPRGPKDGGTEKAGPSSPSTARACGTRSTASPNRRPPTGLPSWGIPTPRRSRSTSPIPTGL